MESHHMPKVSGAIQAALHDITLLRGLVNAKSQDELVMVLAAYTPPIHFNTTELAEFTTSLKDGVITINARMLVDLYDDLQPPKVLRMALWKEWVP